MQWKPLFIVFIFLLALFINNYVEGGRKDKKKDKPGKCPTPTGASACVELCSSDRDCTGKMKCCVNSCGGHICTLPVDTCQLPKVVGPCLASKKRYYFNKETGKCRAFYYGGCFGNENNFRSRRSCRKRCEKKKDD
nr:eppin [Sinohyriopsis cumingii]